MAAKQPYESVVQTPSHLRVDEVRPRVERALDVMRGGGIVCIVEDVADGKAVFAAQLAELATADAADALAVAICHAHHRSTQDRLAAAS